MCGWGLRFRKCHMYPCMCRVAANTFPPFPIPSQAHLDDPLRTHMASQECRGGGIQRHAQRRRASRGGCQKQGCRRRRCRHLHLCMFSPHAVPRQELERCTTLLISLRSDPSVCWLSAGGAAHDNHGDGEVAQPRDADAPQRIAGAFPPPSSFLPSPPSPPPPPRRRRPHYPSLTRPASSHTDFPGPDRTSLRAGRAPRAEPNPCGSASQTCE